MIFDPKPLAEHFWARRNDCLATIFDEMPQHGLEDIKAIVRTEYCRTFGYQPSKGFRNDTGACAAKALLKEQYRKTCDRDVPRSRDFAIKAHGSQMRRHTGEPYWLHLAQVAGILQTFTQSPRALAAAWLHDTIEDCDHTYASLCDAFPAEVADFVLAVSDLEEGKRADRKAAARVRLAAQDAEVQTFKVCDLISNLPSIRKFEPDFYEKAFHPEAVLLLECLDKADPRARVLLNKMLSEFAPK